MRTLVLLLLLLPAACDKQEPPPKLGADVVIRVTGEGTVHWNGERVRLADVAARMRKLDYGAKVVVDGANDADWAHVQWALSLFTRRSLCLPGVSLESRDPVPVIEAYVPLPEELIHGRTYIQVTRTEEGTTQYRFGQRSTTRLHQAYEWIGEAASLLEFGGLLTVEASGTVRYRDLHPVLVAVRQCEHVHLIVGIEHPHPRVMVQDPLPTKDGILGDRRRDLYRKDLAPITLPLALEGVEDRDDDPDARVIINIDSEGTNLYKGEPINLDRFRQALRDARRTYNRIKRLKTPNDPHAGEINIAEGKYVSKLFALLRADQKTPWRCLAPILETLHNGGYFRIQLATQRYATLAHTPEDAVRVGVERIEIEPDRVDGLDCKLACFQPATAPSGLETYVDVEIFADGSFRVDSVETADLGQLTEFILDARSSYDNADPAVIGRVLPRGDTRYQDVISAVDAFNRAGMGRVQLQ